MNTDFRAVPDWFPYENAGAGIAVADLNADGLPLTWSSFRVDDPPEENAAYFRVGLGTDDDLTVGLWTRLDGGSRLGIVVQRGRRGGRRATSVGADSRTCSSSGSTPSPTARTPATTGSAGTSTQPVRSPAGRRGWRCRTGSLGSTPAPTSRSPTWTATACSTSSSSWWTRRTVATRATTAAAR